MMVRKCQQEGVEETKTAKRRTANSNQSTELQAGVDRFRDNKEGTKKQPLGTRNAKELGCDSTQVHTIDSKRSTSGQWVQEEQRTERIIDRRRSESCIRGNRSERGRAVRAGNLQEELKEIGIFNRRRISVGLNLSIDVLAATRFNCRGTRMPRKTASQASTPERSSQASGSHSEKGVFKLPKPVVREQVTPVSTCVEVPISRQYPPGFVPATLPRVQVGLVTSTKEGIDTLADILSGERNEAISREQTTYMTAVPTRGVTSTSTSQSVVTLPQPAATEATQVSTQGTSHTNVEMEVEEYFQWDAVPGPQSVENDQGNDIQEKISAAPDLTPHRDSDKQQEVVEKDPELVVQLEAEKSPPNDSTGLQQTGDKELTGLQQTGDKDSTGLQQTGDKELTGLQQTGTRDTTGLQRTTEPKGDSTPQETAARSTEGRHYRREYTENIKVHRKP
ncbi:hypothetical protein R1sor_011283 [Riccia sorocarpa]|uniref:Uncharacterized protein n=1 Tax=Riccia sorocarpa TaxID=122646 RepID=A0ABD3I375_9MARC